MKRRSCGELHQLAPVSAQVLMIDPLNASGSRSIADTLSVQQRAQARVKFDHYDKVTFQ